MTALRFDGAQTVAFDMSNTENINFENVLTTEATNWRYESESGNTVQLLGSGFAYDAAGRAISGTIETVRVVLSSGDVFAIDVALDAAAIGANPESLWDVLLAANDVINIQELGTETDAASTIFGDRLTADLSRDPKAVAMVGGNDVFLTGTGGYRLVGDVMGVGDLRALKVNGELIARYKGGSDVITGQLTDRKQIVSGDADTVGFNGILTGGNDQLSVATSAENSLLAGDARQAFGRKGQIATVIGGDDEMSALHNANEAFIVGDLAEGADFVRLVGGDDEISARLGNDEIAGDLRSIASNAKASIKGGNDTIDGGGGDDIVAGDAGVFSVLETLPEKPQGKARLNIDAGDDVIEGGDGNDQLFGDVASSGIEELKQILKKINLAGGNDTISGGLGDDDIFGQTGNDRLDGGEGADEIDGGSGRDRITGGLDADFMTGGKGADVFVFTSAEDSVSGNSDIISGFSKRQGDRIDLRQVDADANRDGIQAFDFIGKAAQSDAGELRLLIADGNTFLLADTDGNGTDDFQITFSEEFRLTENDFLF